MKFFYIFLITISCTFIACDDNSNVDFPELEFETLNFGNCYDTNMEKVVIDNDATYQILLDSIFQPYSSNCDSNNHPVIDFSTHTLLGNYRDGGGCSINFIRNLYEDIPNQKYIYDIKVEEEGLCLMLGFSMNWILVPKLPENYTVEFLE